MKACMNLSIYVRRIYGKCLYHILPISHFYNYELSLRSWQILMTNSQDCRGDSKIKTKTMIEPVFFLMFLNEKICNHLSFIH